MILDNYAHAIPGRFTTADLIIYFRMHSQRDSILNFLCFGFSTQPLAAGLVKNYPRESLNNGMALPYYM